MVTPKLTNPQRLEALAQNELPVELQAKLLKVRQSIDDLKIEARAWGVEREFTPDGRFLGDLGELIAKIFFGVKLTIKQEKGHDATDAQLDAETETSFGRKVEVKLRSKSTLIEFSTVPDVVLVIYVSPLSLRWGIVCNGPGNKLLASAKPTKNRFSTDCYKLLAAQQSIGSEDPMLRQIAPLKTYD